MIHEPRILCVFGEKHKTLRRSNAVIAKYTLINKQYNSSPKSFGKPQLLL